MEKLPKVLVGMSGGVDSSLAAYLSKSAGYETSGVTMELSRKLPTDKPGFAGHGVEEDVTDARKVAEKIGIPYEVWNMSEIYREKVVKAFIEGYKKGDTPNPCVSCNQNVKFAALVAKALENGFDLVCTGHYARVLRAGDEGYQESGEPELHRGVNYFKDQSYFVASMPPEVVKYCYFPLGNYFDKSETRAQAKELGMETHNKKDSADICFLEKNAKGKFLHAHFGDSFAGNIVDETGKIVGTHNGHWNFTIGQRRGIDLKDPRADGMPRYVIEIRPEAKEVVVGPRELLQKTTINANDVRIFATDLLDNADNVAPQEFAGFVQIRGHGKVILSKVHLNGDNLTITALPSIHTDTVQNAPENAENAPKQAPKTSVTPEMSQTDGETTPNNDFMSLEKRDYCFDSVARGQSVVVYDPNYNSRVILKATIV